MSYWGWFEAQNTPVAEVLPKQTGDVCLSVAEWAKANLQFTPDKLQAEVLNAREDRLLLLCTRQWGKSTIAAAKALHHAMTEKDALILIASASLRQSRELVRKFKAFAAIVNGKAPKRDEEGYALANGARIVPLPQSPEKIRGFSGPTLIIIDEAAFVTEEMFEAITPSLAASNGALWFLSSANEQKGFFHRTWISRPKGWKLFRATADDCPRISKQFLASERAFKGEADYKRQYFCEFLAGRTQFLDDSFIEAIFDKDFPLLGE